MSRLASAGIEEPLGCRDLAGNRFEGRLPTSLLAMRIAQLLYAPPSVVALEPSTPIASGCRCSLFPQEGCPLARYGREGQNKDANDFGVCVAGPVRRTPFFCVPHFCTLVARQKCSVLSDRTWTEVCRPIDQ